MGCVRITVNKGASGCRLQNKMNDGGLDSAGRVFKNSDDMWREEIGDQSKKSEWYTKGVNYWQVMKVRILIGFLSGFLF